VKPRKPCTSQHWVEYTNPFHVTNSITYGYGLIVVVCPKKGGGARAHNDGIVVKM
jgi:hypothetical protein